MAISVEHTLEEAIDLSPVRLRYDDKDEATGWKAEKVWFGSWQRQRVFSYFKASRSALCSAQTPTEWEKEGHSLAVKRPGHEALIYCPV
jgi:hypothetical protein